MATAHALMAGAWIVAVQPPNDSARHDTSTTGALIAAAERHGTFVVVVLLALAALVLLVLFRGGELGLGSIAVKGKPRRATEGDASASTAEAARGSVSVSVTNTIGPGPTAASAATPAAMPPAMPAAPPPGSSAGGAPLAGLATGPVATSPSSGASGAPSGAALYLNRAGVLFQALEAKQRYVTLAFSWTLEIDDDFDVTVTTTREIRAHEHPLVALCGMRQSDVPLDDFADLRLLALDGAGEPLPWIPAADTPTEKAFIVFFREPLTPDGPAGNITISSTWPQAARKLESPDDADHQRFRLPQAAVGEIPLPTLKVLLPRKRGTFRVVCADPAFDVLVPDPRTKNRTVALPLPNSPGGREIHFTIQRVL